MEEIILEFQNVKKHFKGSQSIRNGTAPLVKAVDDVSFQIRKGKTFAVVGESGSGKTTMAKMIMKFEELSEGKILVKGTDISTLKSQELKTYRKNVQMVHQDPTSSLNPRKTIREVIEEPLIVHKYGNADARLEKVRRLIEVVELPESYINRYPHQLSGGQKQRVGIARAIALNSELIVLDEPTSALDVSVQSKIIELLNHIQQEFHLTYFFITHDLALVRNFADYAIVMQLGQLVEQGGVKDLFERPQNDYTKRLLRSIPVLSLAEQDYLERITK